MGCNLYKKKHHSNIGGAILGTATTDKQGKKENTYPLYQSRVGKGNTELS